ncbi:MAG: hypothetical protein MUE75_13020 [Algoriphagus sp.]|jgi:hypothetical protein|nr:hypothetical protein [Algoriphagus sp.]
MDSEIINQELNNNQLIIVFDRNEERTELNSFGNNPRESFYFKRENFDPPFDDPNLHITVFHNQNHETIKIKQKDLRKYNIWFDSQMGYMDWFRLNFEKYYIIYQDEYLVKGSLDPEHLFTAYEVKIHTGGVE